MSSLRIVPAEGRLRDWLAVPRRIFADDPAWIAPLYMAERARIGPKAPIRSFGETALFLAYRDDVPVGRISAQINRRHLAHHGDATGHFGFFDCMEDAQAASALVETAAQWLRERGMARMAGPFSFTINEECGCLVENFTDPPVVMMAHARPFTGKLLEQAGLTKAMDLYSYRCMPDSLPKLERLAALAARMEGLALRPLDLGRYDAEVRLVIDVFNDAWSGNWGFVPFSDQEAAHIAAELKPVLRGDYGRVLMLRGEPVGIMVAIPDVNGLTADFAGRLLPFNWAKLLWRLQRESAKGGRVLLLGLRKSVQSSPLAGGLLALLAADMMRQKSRYALEWMDFGWVLENNDRMNAFARMIAGAPYKTHRLYQRTL